MDLLDKYKKTWNNQPEEANKLSKVEIYKMAHSRSSSIVKWIFIIGLLEFALMLSSLLFLESNSEIYEEMNSLWLYEIANILSFFIVAFFVIKFYLNYKRITTLDDTKTLMDKIVKTRKTVKNYIIINLTFVSAFLIVFILSIINNKFDDQTASVKIIIICVLIIVGALSLGLIWLFYQLLYGILLKKLNRNYKELTKFDNLN